MTSSEDRAPTAQPEPSADADPAGEVRGLGVAIAVVTGGSTLAVTLATLTFLPVVRTTALLDGAPLMAVTLAVAAGLALARFHVRIPRRLGELGALLALALVTGLPLLFHFGRESTIASGQAFAAPALWIFIGLGLGVGQLGRRQPSSAAAGSLMGLTAGALLSRLLDGGEAFAGIPAGLLCGPILAWPALVLFGVVHLRVIGDEDDEPAFLLDVLRSPARWTALAALAVGVTAGLVLDRLSPELRTLFGPDDGSLAGALAGLSGLTLIAGLSTFRIDLLTRGLGPALLLAPVGGAFALCRAQARVDGLVDGAAPVRDAGSSAAELGGLAAALWPLALPLGLILAQALRRAGKTRCAGVMAFAVTGLGAGLGLASVASPGLGPTALISLATALVAAAAFALETGRSAGQAGAGEAPPTGGRGARVAIAALTLIALALALSLRQAPDALFVAEGRRGRVSVHDDEETNRRILRVAGETVGEIPRRLDKSSQASLDAALALAAFPAMLTETTGSARVIGLGTGVTLGGVLTFDFKTVALVAPEPAILAAHRDPGELFSRVDMRPFEDARLTILEQDAASCCGPSRREGADTDAVDLLILDPPTRTASADQVVFTVEVLRRFAAGARVFAMRFDLGRLDAAELRAQLATVLAVEPDCLAFEDPAGRELILIGGIKRFTAMTLAERLNTRGRRGGRKASSSGLADMLSCFLAGPKALRALAGEAEPRRLSDRLRPWPRRGEGRARERRAELAAGAGELFEVLGDGDEALRRRLILGAAEGAILREAYPVARSMLLALLEREESAEVHRLLGDLAFKQGEANRFRGDEKAEALARWKKALALEPKSVAPRLSLAAFHVNTGRPKEALTVLDPGLTGDPAHDAPLHLLMGRIEEALKNYASAYGHYRLAGNHGKAAQRARLVKELAEHEGTPILGPAGPRRENPKVLLKAARRMARSGKRQAAVELFRKVERLRPRDASVKFERARVLIDMKREREALTALEESLALDRSALRVRREHAELLLRMGQPREALAAFERILAENGRELRTLRSQLGAVAALTRLGRAEEALARLAEVEGLAPSHVLLPFHRGRAYAALGEEDKARTNFQTFLARSPKTHPLRPLVEQWLATHKP